MTATVLGGASRRERFAFWEQPHIVTGRALDGRIALDDGDDDSPQGPDPHGLTPEELEVRRQHLEALGYVG